MVQTATKPRMADEIREYVRETYINPARERGDRRFSITAGDVHKALRYHNRVPAVVTTLRGKRFLLDNGLRLIDQSGPPSGMSTTVRITYEFEGHSAAQAASAASRDEKFRALRGLLKDVFRELGGGENFIRREREGWDDDRGAEK